MGFTSLTGRKKNESMMAIKKTENRMLVYQFLNIRRMNYKREPMVYETTLCMNHIKIEFTFDQNIFQAILNYRG